MVVRKGSECHSNFQLMPATTSRFRSVMYNNCDCSCGQR